jgi:hypothetical protein
VSTMKNHLRSSLSRLALCGLAAPLILLLPTLVRADAITEFAVSGTATNLQPIPWALAQLALLLALRRVPGGHDHRHG